MFVTVGMSQQAVEAFTKANLVQEAIDSCVSLNQVQLNSIRCTVLVSMPRTCTGQLCCTASVFVTVGPGSGAG